jgi:hypothetical protein
MFQKVFAHVMAENLLAQMSGNLFRTAIPEGNALLAIDKVNADRQFGQHSSINFYIVDHRPYV